MACSQPHIEVGASGFRTSSKVQNFDVQGFLNFFVPTGGARGNILFKLLVQSPRLWLFDYRGLKIWRR